MALPIPSLLTIKAIAVLTGTFLSGSMSSISTLSIPVILTAPTNPPSPSHLLHQWARTYHYGHRVLPALCVITCGLYTYLAYTTHNNIGGSRGSGEDWRVFAIAGLTTAGMLPWTWVVMTGTNNRLFGGRAFYKRREQEGGRGGRLEKDGGVGGEGEGEGEGGMGMGMEEARGLVRRWNWLHLARSMFPLVGAVVGMGEVCGGWGF